VTAPIVEVAEVSTHEWPIRISDPFLHRVRIGSVDSSSPAFAGDNKKGTAMTDETNERSGVTRLSFIKTSAGAAAGMAAVGVPVAAARAEEKGIETQPSTPTPPEPVTAYVRDARRGEVTVLSGSGEKTYRDRALVKRLMAAAPQD
jgi:hypothetical protein